MNEYNKFIRFDWAAKRMLRDKANFGVLEGLVQVLIGEPITIVEILESEADRDGWGDKFNRIDIKATNSYGEVILVEIQQIREFYYRKRVLYGVDDTITEHKLLGQEYDQVKRVYSISIFYFDFGRGTDYLYHGLTRPTGVHTGDQLQISAKAEDVIKMVSPENIIPEYFIIRVNEFNQTAKTPLEEWLSYLKDGFINKDTTTPGLQEAHERLQRLMLPYDARRAYERYLDNVMVENDVFDTARDEGFAEGFAEGLAEGFAESLEKGCAEGVETGLEKGRTKAKTAMARKMKAMGFDTAVIAQITGLTPDEIASLE